MNVGSLPEWVSASATLGVFVTARTLLRGAHVRARKAEAGLARAEVERRRSLKDHFLGILDDAGDATAEAMTAFNIEQADHIYYKHYALFQTAVHASACRIERLQSFPGLPIDIYCICDRFFVVLTSARLSASLDETAIETMNDLQHNLRSIREDVVLAD